MNIVEKFGGISVPNWGDFVSILPLVIHLPSHHVRFSSCHWQLVGVKSKRLVGDFVNVPLLYRATLIGIDERVLTIPTEGSRVGCLIQASG